jgi:hypothetical protein
MLGQCSLRHRFPVCSSGGNSNRKSSLLAVGVRFVDGEEQTQQAA